MVFPLTEIRYVYGHYEAYVDNHFVVSADTYEECVRELNYYLGSIY